MNEIHHALISQLEESYQHDPACVDVVMYQGAYHRILQISKKEEDIKDMLNIRGMEKMQKLFIGKVRKILNAREGGFQWEII
ncbi:MAG: hypothetical protein PHQ95_01775 [Candidatus Gracilibacteria bacterium]|nr:hypothetical protein [Candidatus Gracilibacteria bacterium]